MSDLTALVVEVPEVEPLVQRWRLRHDPSAARGMPAHVTVLYPLGPHAEIRGSVARICRAHRSFDVAFDAVATFDRDVVWLRPSPDSGLRAVTAAAVAAFPDWPPYGGTIADPTPHLTVADCDASIFDAVLADVRADVEPRLPVPVHVTGAALFGESDEGRWVRLERFPFSAGA
jgi:2'-5' RNA ligase